MAAITAKKRYTLYVILFMLLVGGYAYTLLDLGEVNLPTRARIREQRKNLRHQQQKLQDFIALQNTRETLREEVAQLALGYWRADSKKPPTTEIQSKIERLGNQTGVRLNRVGAPKIVEISDNLVAVEVQISSATSIRKFARFCRELENHRPRLVWEYCSIRPNRQKDPTGILLSGRVRAYVLSREASAYLRDSGKERKP